MYYKNRYHIVFYELDDETYVAGFNSIKDICRYKGLPITTTNIAKINCQLYQSLRKTPSVSSLLGKKMYVYLVDMTTEDEN